MPVIEQEEKPSEHAGEAQELALLWELSRSIWFFFQSHMKAKGLILASTQDTPVVLVGWDMGLRCR